MNEWWVGLVKAQFSCGKFGFQLQKTQKCSLIKQKTPKIEK